MELQWQSKGLGNGLVGDIVVPKLSVRGVQLFEVLAYVGPIPPLQPLVIPGL